MNMLVRRDFVNTFFFIESKKIAIID